MSRRYRPGRFVSATSVGWLFADLLLALAVLFLASTTSTVSSSTPIVTPTPTQIPTATPVPRLETAPQRLALTIDPNGILADRANAVESVKQQIRSQKILRGRDVGIAIVYDGAPDDAEISTAESIDGKIYAILRRLGQEKFAFSRASYYDPLFVLGADLSRVVIDVYLFEQT